MPSISNSIVLESSGQIPGSILHLDSCLSFLSFLSTSLNQQSLVNLQTHEYENY